MDVSSQYDASSSGSVADVGEIMQAIAEHKGCGTSGGSGKASCGSQAG